MNAVGRIYKPRRINTRSIFDIKTGRLIHRDSYQYAGPMALATMAAMDLTGYGLYNDDGTEATATIIGSQDAQQTITVNTVFHIRFEVTETGGASANANGMIYEFNHAAAGFVDLTASSSVLQAVSSMLTNDADASQRLGGGGTYDATNAWVNDDGTLANNTVSANNIAESVMSVQIIGADVSDGDEIIVRMKALDAYTSAGADIDVNKPAGGLGIPLVMHGRSKNYGAS